MEIASCCVRVARSGSFARLTVALALLSMMFGAPATAAIVVAAPDNSTPLDADLFSFMATGGNMGPMAISVTFVDSTTSSDTWTGTSANTGSAGTGGWSLTQSFDTFFFPWTFVNNTGKGIRSLTIGAALGAVVFDIVKSPEVTPGSSIGWPFQQLATNQAVLNGTAKYSLPIGTDGNAPLYDLYGKLVIDFTDAGGLGNYSYLKFRSDTDLLTAAVPEPRAFLFGGLVCGVIGLGVGGRWLKNKLFDRS